LSKRAIGVLIACILTVFAAYAIRYSYGTLLPEMLYSLDITKAQAGAIYSSYFIAYTVLSPITGMLSDRYDMRILISVFVAIMGLGTFLMQYPTSIIQASVFFAIAGIGCAACWAPVMAVASRWTNPNRRGLTLAIVDAGSTLGVMAAGSLVPLAVSFSNWRLGWMSLGILGLALGAVDFILIRSYPKSNFNSSAAGTPPSRRTGRTTYKLLFKDSRFWLIGLAYLMTGFAIMMPFTFISTFAVQELSFSYDSATMLVTIIGAGGLVGKLTLGPISDKVGRIKIMIICAILISGGCLAIAFTNGLVLMVFTFVFGFGYGAVWSMYAACASDFFPNQGAGGIIGLWTFYLGFGLLTSPVIGGWLADTTGTLMFSFIGAAVAGILSLLLILPILKEKQAVYVKTL
jgi:MFS family permease